MNRLLIILWIVIFSILMISAQNRVINIKTDIKMDNKKGYVLFDHYKHFQKFGCQTCHHKITDQQIKSCKECHKENTKKIFHKKCKTCHKKYKINTTCKTCHIKE